MYGIHVCNICICWFETFVWICWLGNYPNSFFVYVWVRETLTLQYMCILVGSSPILRWVSFGWKISDKNGQNWPFLQKSQVSTGSQCCF